MASKIIISVWWILSSEFEHLNRDHWSNVPFCSQITQNTVVPSKFEKIFLDFVFFEQQKALLVNYLNNLSIPGHWIVNAVILYFEVSKRGRWHVSLKNCWSDTTSKDKHMPLTSIHIRNMKYSCSMAEIVGSWSVIKSIIFSLATCWWWMGWRFTVPT